MTPALLAFAALAALDLAPATPAPAGSEPPQMRDIAPPLDLFPYSPWMIAAAAGAALALLALLGWLLLRWLRHRPPPPLPSATEIALRALGALQQRVRELEPYAFSILVADVLRTFISSAKFSLPATRQTSPEFLAAIAASPSFTAEDRALLARFMEKCDLIKFARVAATSEDNAELVQSALAFVQGGRA